MAATCGLRISFVGYLERCMLWPICKSSSTSKTRITFHPLKSARSTARTLLRQENYSLCLHALFMEELFNARNSPPRLSYRLPAGGLVPNRIKIYGRLDTTDAMCAFFKNAKILSRNSRISRTYSSLWPNRRRARRRAQDDRQSSPLCRDKVDGAKIHR